MMNHGTVCAGGCRDTVLVHWRVPFDGVGSCGGGGVVASLMDDVWWKRGV